MFSYKKNRALIKDLIKSFPPCDLIKDFHLFFSFFFSLRWKIIIRPLIWHIYRQSDCIHGKPKVRLGSPEVVVIYFESIKYHLKKHNQSIATPLSRYATRKSVAWQDKTAAWGTNSLRAQPITVSSRKVPPHKYDLYMSWLNHVIYYACVNRI